MRMIDKIIRAMQDTGLIDGMSMEDADTLATAALEAMRDPSVAMKTSVSANWGRRTWADYDTMIDAALNE